jgi:peptidoglycan/LPS O-acetylase OafA/YrhL
LINGKIVHLDGLRGLAALSVVFSHFIVTFYPALWNGNIEQTHSSNGIEVLIANTPLNFFYNGNVPVCIFFVLSAYVLSYKFFVYGDYEIITKSASRRYFRLQIPVLFSILVAWLLLKLGLYSNIQAAPLTLSNWWLATFWNFEPNFFFALKQAFWDVFFDFNNNGIYNSVLWTMQCELNGSFFVFAFLGIFGKSSIRFFFYIVCLAIFMKTYYLAFVLGLILSDVYNSPSLENIRKLIQENKIITPLAIVIGVFLGAYFDNRNLYHLIELSRLKEYGFDLFSFYHIIGAFFIVLAVLNSYKLQKILSNEVCLFLGRISFSLYLMHLMIICSLTTSIFLMAYQYNLSYKISVILSFLISIFVILGVSYLTAKYIDEPAIKFSKYLQYKFLK